MRQFNLLITGLIFTLMFTFSTEVKAAEKKITAEDALALKGKCVTCHKRTTPGIYHQWKSSSHAKHNVSCYDCHRASESEEDGFMHEGLRVATLVTPKDCGRCHQQESKEFQSSYHAKAGKILDSSDNYLAGAMGGLPAVVNGCEQCHGGKVELDQSKPNKLSPLSFPNSGIGRINPDGSSGSCSACHVRHAFSKAQARKPENCGKCHLGPDHPQKEIYEESKHGISYRANADKLNIDKESWVVGVDYSLSPTCASCHMSATPKQQVSHDIGNRISWTLRPIVSKGKENAKERRKNMMDVCHQCHGPRFIQSFYTQFDGLVNLYNDKYAKPALAVMKILKKNGSLKDTEGKKAKASFSSKVEWIFWELWHHEGRRARHGAAMMGPDYAWWHGIYEVGHHFYFKFIPEVRKLKDKEANEYIAKILQEPYHKWLSDEKKVTADKMRTGRMADMYKDLFVPPWETAAAASSKKGGH
ncbi:MAG: multiheme c-type cytochrome [Planctomycetota bacterium]|jgi:hypothetical protein